jgi:hypothetical protein
VSVVFVVVFMSLNNAHSAQTCDGRVDASTV